MTETKKNIEVVTFGCRLNTYESEVIRQNAVSAGLSHDHTIIFNTCAVTAAAERKARSAIRRAHLNNPQAHIIVTGCSAQIKPHAYAALPGVARVLGNDEKMRPDIFDGQAHPTVQVGDIMTVRETAAHLMGGFEQQVRAFIEIQNGCDHRCTFCTIPFGRGNNRSVPMGAIVQQVRTLMAKGCLEVVLTGVDITGYGGDLPGTPTLGQLVKRLLAAVPDLPRLRLSSLDPVEIDPDLYQVIISEPRLMPHLHLSVQAGDDMILKRMKRRHLRHHVTDLCHRLRRDRPDIVFGADIIAGFPTETDDMFQNSLSLMADCGFTYLHVFPYSPREGTPAARMPQVPRHIIKKRAEALRNLGSTLQSTFFHTMVGQTYPVLIERGGKGHTPHFAPVLLRHPDGTPVEDSSFYGTLHPVRITSLTAEGPVGVLWGDCASPEKQVRS